MKGEVDLLLHVIHGEKLGHESSLFFGILQERIHVAPYQVVLLNALLFSVCTSDTFLVGWMVR